MNEKLKKKKKNKKKKKKNNNNKDECVLIFSCVLRDSISCFVGWSIGYQIVIMNRSEFK